MIRFIIRVSILRKVNRYKKGLFLVACLVCLLGCFCCAWADDEDFEPSVDFEPIETPTYTPDPAPDPEPSLYPEQETNEQVQDNENFEDNQSDNSATDQSDNSGSSEIESETGQQETQVIDYSDQFQSLANKVIDLHNDNFKLMICIFVFMGSVLGFLVVKEILH